MIGQRSRQRAAETPFPGLGVRLRQELYFGYQRARGRSLGAVYRRYRREDRARTAADGVPDRLRALLRHARASVPYYRDHLEGMQDAIEEDPLAALAQLPLLTKPLIRQRFGSLQSADILQRRTRLQTSGGSTGEPVRLIQDADYQDSAVAVKLLYSTWAGREPGEPAVEIWGSEEEILRGSSSRRARLASRLTRVRVVNAFRMSEDSMRSCLADLNRRPPKLIVAYVQSIDDLAAAAEREGIDVVPQRAIISTAGVLQPQMRERIERVFGCRVFDRYGSREVGDIAGECAHHRGLHVFPWTCYVEIVGEDGSPVGPGESGRLVVTSLSNFAMPLIRYEIGDRASAIPAGQPPCPCGRAGERIARLVGRTVDTFKAPDGSLVNGEYFTHLLYYKDSIRKFQVVQESRSRIVYRLVLSAPLPPEEREEVIRGTRAVMGPGCEVEFEFAKEIPPSPSGKHRYTISEI